MVLDTSFAQPITDAASIITKVKASKPDIFAFHSYIADSILLVKTGHRLEAFNFPWFASGTITQPGFGEAVKELGEGIFDFNIWAFDISKEANAFNEKYRAKYNKDLDGVASLLYQSVYVLKEALEKTGKVDREALAQTLRKIKIEPGPNLLLPYDFISFDDKGVNPGGRFIYAQMQNQRWVTVYPENRAGHPLKIMPSWKK